MLSVESASVRDAETERRVLDSADVEMLRARTSVEIPVLRAVSATPNDVAAVLVA